LGESSYAVEADAVQEIVSLPEISHLDEVPTGIAGALNLRGRIVFVIDLLAKFGHPPQTYTDLDSIVILQRSGELVAVLITHPLVVEIGADDLLPEQEIRPEAELSNLTPFVRGLVKWDDQVAMRLRVESLFAFAQDLARDPDESAGPSTNVEFPLSIESKSLLVERAKRLAQPDVEQNAAGLVAYAVVGLGGELFGIEMQTVREFAKVQDITPIPGCPPHIAGQLSCRGDLITAVEISSLVGVSPPRNHFDQKLVIMHDPRLAAGVLVDELLDILYLPANEPRPASKLGSRAPSDLGRDHFRGTANYLSRTLTLIDLPALLAHESLQVNETPI
jgi:purine-binding chemotaxis protein CheW